MGKEVDITGQKFNMLTAIKRVENYRPTGTYWLCKCDCGNECVVRKYDLIHSKQISCNCYQKKSARENHIKHDGRYTKLYPIWNAMKQRCQNPNSQAYRNYGGRGIKVCPEWQEFIPFMEWSYANGYDENAKRGECTLDRKDVNGNYCPENCRWVTTEEQNNNKRTNRKLTFNGETHTLTEWSEITGIPKNTIKNRLDKSHLPVEEALFQESRNLDVGTVKAKKEKK